MDLTSAICNLQQSQVLGRIQIAVARKLLDTQQAQGAAAVKLIQAASDNSSKAGDALVAAATGLGGMVDTFG
jgi:hypothetical protein